MPTTIRGADNFDTEVGQKGAAKAWVNFDGAGMVTIRDSYNVSSITDNGTGDYTINFATAMPDVNYTPLGSTITERRLLSISALNLGSVVVIRRRTDTSGTSEDGDVFLVVNGN